MPVDEPEVLANLRDPSMEIRQAALADVERAGVLSFVKVDVLVDALRIAVRIGPDKGLAVRLLGELGPRGAAAGLDLCRCLAAVPDPAAAAATLIAFGTLVPHARAVLADHARDDRADVAAAASRVLELI